MSNDIPNVNNDTDKKLMSLLTSLRLAIKQVHRTMSGSGHTSIRQALLLSSSNCYGFSMLEFARPEIDKLFQKNGVTELLFVPYAQNDYDSYTVKIKAAIENWGYKVTGIHTQASPEAAVKSAQAVFIANVATWSIHTTNDMPIDYPPSFDGIGIVPFNINPHYLETPDTTHRGETRDQRIEEFLETLHGRVVLGLREGAILHVDGDTATVKGIAGAVVFSPQIKSELPVGADVSHLMCG